MAKIEFGFWPPVMLPSISNCGKTIAFNIFHLHSRTVWLLLDFVVCSCAGQVASVMAP